MADVINIDGTEFKTPIEAINDALESLTCGDFQNCQKVLIIGLNDSDGQYDVSYIRNDMTHAETIALIEVLKLSLAGEMGY